MNTRHSIVTVIALAAGTVPLLAGPRTSTSYSIPADSTDAGGKRTASASYTNDGSAGGIAGISTGASNSETAKAGYIGQLYDVTGLTLTSAGTSVNETASLQLGASLALDDATGLALPATEVAWSVLSGPLTGVSAGGLATADVVPQNTAAIARGLFAGFSGTLGITVVNTIPDNFGTYAADGIADDWQAQFFGLNNPAAGPSLDPDDDGFDNRFEFNAGIIPTDPASVFHLRMEPVPGQAGKTQITFSPRLPDRHYEVKTSTSLLPNTWLPVSGGTVTDNGSERTVTDPDTSAARKFYRVEISKP